VGLLCARFREADEVESWEVEIFVEDIEAVDPLVSLDGTSEGRIDSDVKAVDPPVVSLDRVSEGGIDSDVCSVCNY
jgi:hypothetical protein